MSKWGAAEQANRRRGFPPKTPAVQARVGDGVRDAEPVAWQLCDRRVFISTRFRTHNQAGSMATAPTVLGCGNRARKQVRGAPY